MHQFFGMFFIVFFVKIPALFREKIKEYDEKWSLMQC